MVTHTRNSCSAFTHPKCTHSSEHTHTHTAVNTHTHTHTHTHTAVNTHTHTHTHSSKHTPGAVNTHTHSDTHSSEHTHTHTHTHTQHEHTHTAVNTHTHYEQTPRAVGSHLCCSARGIVGGSVHCSRVSPQWFWGWRDRCTFTPPTYNPCRTKTQTFRLQFFPIANTPKWHAQHNYLNWHTESKTSSQVSKSLNTFSAIHTFCISKWHFLNTLNTVLCITHNNLK